MEKLWNKRLIIDKTFSFTYVKMNLEQESKKLGKEAKKLIEDICEVAWTRTPGSEGEMKAQAFLNERLKEYGADVIEVRKYKV